jgi:ribonuclease P protein component
MATQENSTQERAWVSQEDEHTRRPGCHKGKTAKGTQEINCSITNSSSSGHIVKREARLTKPEQFDSVYNSGSTQKDRFLVLKNKPNQLEYSRYGISVSKRVGNAVIRNRVKRILREILRLTPLNPGWDIILIVRSPSAESGYHQLEESAVNLLSRAHIVEK